MHVEEIEPVAPLLANEMGAPLAVDLGGFCPVTVSYWDCVIS
jgi:hypothetical protein